MEEFTKDMLEKHHQIVNETFELIKINEDKYSTIALTNFNITIHEILRLACTLMLDVQSGKIYKPAKPTRKVSAWKKKKNKITQEDIKA